MNDTGKPEFDRYAASYNALHTASIKASGEEPAYFAAYKARYMARRLAVDATPIVAPVILDFGCGVGNSIGHLHAAFPAAALHGADLSSASIALARTAYGQTASFSVIEDTRLTYPDAAFDAVFVACVFHHIAPTQRLHWMQELRRVLRPGGQIFVFEHNLLNPLTVKSVRDCPFDEDAILLPRHELLGLARQAGFGNVNAQYIVFFPHALAALRPLEPWLGWLPLGAQYVVHATA